MTLRKPGKNIASLVRLLTVLALLSGIAIVALGVFGIHNIFSHHVINMAEKEAVVISQLLVEQHRSFLFNEDIDDSISLQIDPSYQGWLDTRLRDFLHPFDIRKIKIFTPDSRIIYSTDRKIIGETNSDNLRLQNALKGKIDSHLATKDSLRDLRDETAIKVDVVETYSPIIIDNQIYGVFELYMDVTKFRQDIREGTIKSLAILSAILLLVYLVAFAIARMGMKQVQDAEARLRDQAMHDALTGIFNRGELMLRVEEEVSRVERHGPTGGNGELSLIMIDIDHFKRVNDTYGHQIGDEVLRQMPDRIKKGLRRYDVMGRYGGEEFLVMLPNADIASTANVAERIRTAVANEPFACGSISLNVSISLGVSSFAPGVSLEQAIKLADDALYRAKQAGRNCCEIQAPPA